MNDADGSAADPDAARFAARVLVWFDRHGRKHLPWQQRPTRYRVWVSEIMLQQTQVATVIPYYQRFIQRFPELGVLADAPLDEVLSLWSGLGYYARARNLHRAAGMVRDRYRGELPDTRAELETLPGIGRSTAAAILALSAGRRETILDGNVKRVLSRFAALPGWPGEPRVLAQLWRLAERHTPSRRVGAYTQAMMDLGATVCTRRAPRCGHCPLAADCRALALGRVDDFPAKKPRRERPLRVAVMLLISIRDADGCTRVLLERRPATGIWGGLWGFPECPPELSLEMRCRQLGVVVTASETWAELRHGFTHFQLDITPLRVWAEPVCGLIAGGGERRWIDPTAPPGLGLAAPVQKLLTLLGEGLLAQRHSG